MPGLFVLLVAVVAVGMVIVLVKLITSLARPRSNWRRPPELQPRPDPLMTSMADDGFWITGDQVNPASMLQYYYWVQGAKRTGEVPFQPGPDGRQFIYTGEKPDNVSVALAGAALSADPPDPIPPVVSTPSFTSPRSTSDQSHFPRAY